MFYGLLFSIVLAVTRHNYWKTLGGVGHSRFKGNPQNYIIAHKTVVQPFSVYLQYKHNFCPNSLAGY